MLLCFSDLFSSFFFLFLTSLSILMNPEEIKKYFDDKFALLAAKCDVAGQLKQKTLKYKGNQCQLHHETSVLLGVRTAEACLREEDIEAATEELRQTSQIIEKRIKLMRLADRSEHGWKTVSEYVSDSLATDSDDDKKIKEPRQKPKR